MPRITLADRGERVSRTALLLGRAACERPQGRRMGFDQYMVYKSLALGGSCG